MKGAPARAPFFISGMQSASRLTVHPQHITHGGNVDGNMANKLQKMAQIQGFVAETEGFEPSVPG